MFYGILDLPWWGHIIAILGFIHFTVIGITLYLHRAQAHRALELHPVVSHVLRMWLWLSTGMNTKEWAAIHRKHHAHCETEDDPHSPVILGIKTVLLQGAELYRKEAKNKETMERYGQGTPEDWIENNLYSRFPSLGIILMFVIDILLFGVAGITIWAMQMLFTPLFAAGVINGIGHYWGYRNFECKDAAKNIMPWGLFLGGEELHNNHHTYGTSAKFSVKKWEFDIGWFYIKLLSKLKLAKPKRIPPELHIDPAKRAVDFDTLKALISNRFQIMSRYGKEVVLPVVKELKANKKQQFLENRVKLKNKFYRLIMREEALVKPSQRIELNRLFKDYAVLKTVYQYRQRLQAIWEKSSLQASPKELLEALQEWCKQAEASKIQALKEFAKSIRTYTKEPLPA